MKEQNRDNANLSYEKVRSTNPNEKDGLIYDNKNDLYSDYKNFKWAETEKLRNGPFGDESRKCRDCICCIIFIIFFIGCLLTAAVGFGFGKPKKILYPYDEDGHACGYDKGYEDYKMLYFYNVIENLQKLKVKNIVNAFCVKECPIMKYDKKEYANKKIFLNCIKTSNNPDCNVTYKNYYRSKELLKRFCFPSDADKEEFDPTTQEKLLVYDYSKDINIERIVDKDDISSDGVYVKIEALKEQNTSKVASEKLINLSFFSSDRLINWLSDVFVTKWVIFASVIWSFIISMIFLLFLRCCAGIIVFLILVGIFVGLVILSIILRFKMYDYEDKGDDSKKTIFCILFWICVILAAIWLLFVLIMCNRIRLSIALIQISAKYINENCSILIVPFLFFFLTIGWIAYWAVLSVYLYSSGDFDKEHSKVFASFKWKYHINYLFWYHLFALFYINAILSALSQFIYASSTSIWYFNHDKGTEGHFILTSFKRAFKYHFGSIAFGSLIIAIVRFLMFFLEMFKKRAEKSFGKKKQGKCFKCLICCLECCLRCITKFLEFINKHAYIMISIKGDSFCTAAWEGFALAVRNLGRFSVLTLLGKLFSNIGTLFIMTASGIIGYLVINNYGFLSEEIDSAFLPVFCMVIIGLIIGLISMNVFGMSADTLLYCFLIDEEINKGLPKAMPELQKFMSDER